jgi:glycerol kinase
MQVLALGITNQRETCLVWDRNTGQPLHNALVWLDGRTSDLCARMEKELGSKVRMSGQSDPGSSGVHYISLLGGLGHHGIHLW